ncbi:YncE family protein [Brevundimonas staleyi]|uniref:YncE family protein n=1 Tax=Brevundimonas staleyi TaxID=74326 RepID=A0ABW0FWI0_9CAUL
MIRPTLSLTAAVAALIAASSALAEPTVERSVKVAPGGLYEIVFNPADDTVLVAAVGPRGANAAAIASLSADLTPGRTIDVSANPLYGLALNSRTQTLYGTDTRTGLISAIDLATGRVVANIGSDRENAHVRQVVVDEAANKVYVSEVGGRGANTLSSRIWIIDGATNTLERQIDVDAVLTGLAVDAAGGRVFSTDMTANEVVVVNLASGEVAHRWATGTESAINVAYDAAGDRLFVASQGTGELTVMKASDGSVIQRVPTGAGALSVAFNGAVDQVYVANRQAGTVTVVDADDYSVLANLQTGTFPQTIAIDRATNAVYVTNKARGLPRDAPAGAPVPVDPTGDTVTIIRP